MLFVLSVLFVITACRIIDATPTQIRTATYDQRQTGDLNVHIALKDLHVVALLDSMDDYTDYDYFYDYADFTVKPGGNRPTTNPITEESNIMNTSESLSSSNSTISISSNINSTERNTIMLSNDEEISNTDSSNINLASNADNDKSQSNKDNRKSETIASSTMMKSAVRSQKRCKSGYIPNGNGRCRRTNRPWLSLLS